jgi:hypothetical protein
VRIEGRTSTMIDHRTGAAKFLHMGRQLQRAEPDRTPGCQKDGGFLCASASRMKAAPKKWIAFFRF